MTTLVKYFFLFSLVILILSGCSIAGTKSYESSNLKLSFSVPSAWAVTEKNENGLLIETPEIEKSDDGCGSDYGTIWVSVTPNPKNLNINELYKSFNDSSTFWPERFNFNRYENSSGLTGIQFPEIDESVAGQTCPVRTVTNVLDTKNRRMLSVHYSHLEEFPQSSEKTVGSEKDAILVLEYADLLNSLQVVE